MLCAEHSGAGSRIGVIRLDLVVITVAKGVRFYVACCIMFGTLCAKAFNLSNPLLIDLFAPTQAMGVSGGGLTAVLRMFWTAHNTPATKQVESSRKSLVFFLPMVAY